MRLSDNDAVAASEMVAVLEPAPIEAEAETTSAEIVASSTAEMVVSPTVVTLDCVEIPAVILFLIVLSTSTPGPGRKETANRCRWQFVPTPRRPPRRSKMSTLLRK